MEKKCSVIILNWNGEQVLNRYLPSVVEHTYNDDYEVVVADNGSTDNSLSMLKEKFPTVRILTFDKNYGFAEGYNLAIKHTHSQYIVLLNSDVEVTQNWLSPILSYMDEHQDIAAAQPKILSDKNRLYFEHAGAAGGYMDALAYPYCRGRILNYVEQDKGQYDSIADIFWASGACLVIRTDIFKSVGGLDADFFAHMEEIDLCWRLNSRGHRLVCVPQSTVYHLGGASLSYDNPRKTYLNFRNNLLMVYKNAQTFNMLKILVCRCILDYVAALQNLLSGHWKNSLAICRARIDFWRMLPTYIPKRKINLSLTINPYPNTISKRLIIFDYYLRGMRK